MTPKKLAEARLGRLYLQPWPIPDNVGQSAPPSPVRDFPKKLAVTYDTVQLVWNNGNAFTIDKNPASQVEGPGFNNEISSYSRFYRK